MLQIDCDQGDAASDAPEPSMLVLRQPVRKPPGRPATSKQRLFDVRLKPFEKLRAADRDIIRLRWFVDEAVVLRTVRGGEPAQLDELKGDIASQACDLRAVVGKVACYFDATAWDAVLQWMNNFPDNSWSCSRRGHNTVAPGIQQSKWIQCDHCLSWIHYQCAAVTQKPQGYYFCSLCK